MSSPFIASIVITENGEQLIDYRQNLAAQTATEIDDSVIISQAARDAFATLPSSGARAMSAAGGQGRPLKDLAYASKLVALYDQFNRYPDSATVAIDYRQTSSSVIDAADHPGDGGA